MTEVPVIWKPEDMVCKSVDWFPYDRGLRQERVTSFSSVKTVKLFIFTFKPFVPNVLFLCPLSTYENHKVFRCFQRVEKGCNWCFQGVEEWSIGNEWVNTNEENIFQKILHTVIAVILTKDKRNYYKVGYF